MNTCINNHKHIMKKCAKHLPQIHQAISGRCRWYWPPRWPAAPPVIKCSMGVSFFRALLGSRTTWPRQESCWGVLRWFSLVLDTGNEKNTMDETENQSACGIMWSSCWRHADLLTSVLMCFHDQAQATICLQMHFHGSKDILHLDESRMVTLR
jgi:hypothetical protein